MLYIMRRTQLYLDDDLWNALHVQARREQTSISELVRKAARDRYLGGVAERGRAMKAIVGMWKDRPEFDRPSDYVRDMRQGDRIEKLRRP